MDNKEKRLLEQITAAIQEGSFRERDVLAFFILLRRHAPKDSPVREIGDFIAHRDRDRGVLLKYIAAVRLALNSQGPTVQLPVWTIEQLQKSVNDVLNTSGMLTFDRETANRLLVCVITLLQSVRLEPVSRDNYLAVGLSSSYIGLFGHGVVRERAIFQFPLLIAENNGYEFSLKLHEVNFFMRADRIIEAFAANGEFHVEERRLAA